MALPLLIIILDNLSVLHKKPIQAPLVIFQGPEIQYCHISGQQLLRPYKLYQGYFYLEMSLLISQIPNAKLKFRFLSALEFFNFARKTAW